MDTVQVFIADCEHNIYSGAVTLFLRLFDFRSKKFIGDDIVTITHNEAATLSSMRRAVTRELRECSPRSVSTVSVEDFLSTQIRDWTGESWVTVLDRAVLQ